MDDIFGNDDGLLNLDDIAGKVTDDSGKKRTDFKPWHKPRKQFIRDKQWWFHLERLLTRAPAYNDVSCIKYFGLPGGDLLDVHFFIKRFQNHETLVNKKMLVHGFIDNQQDKQWADARLSELLDFDNFDQESRIDRHKFQSLSDENAVALGKIKRSIGYHFVNLDFCDSVFNQRTLDALVVLLHEQFKSMVDIPWVCCITTRSDREGIAKDVYQTLNDIFKNKFWIDEQLIKALQNSFDQLLEKFKGSNLSDLDDADCSILLQVCFIYWTITRAHKEHTKVSLVSAINYNVHGKNNFPDMYSYVFRFEKEDHIPVDDMGLVANAGAQSIPLTDEQAQNDKMNSFSKLSRAWNVDDEIHNNPESFRVCLEQIKELLSECGWDVDAYERDFLQAC